MCYTYKAEAGTDFLSEGLLLLFVKWEGRKRMGRIKRYFSNMKIRKKMMLSYLLACVVPLAVSCLVIYRSAEDNLQKSSLEFADIFNSQIVSNIETFCEEYNNMTRLVLVDNDILTRLDQQ